MQIIQNYPDNTFPISTKCDSFLTLPIVSGLFNLSRMYIPEHDTVTRWKEFLFQTSMKSEDLITESQLSTLWRAWASKAKFYRNINNGRATRPRVRCTLTKAPEIDGAPKIYFTEEQIAQRNLEAYNREQLLAMGFNPDTGMRNTKMENK